ncbi:phage tail protein [Pseudomonas putida]|uniref:phage tail-collar fiber domain-containing protein n=1 Tax=Pseudomonas putida TaxID=303 RepID=UPI00235CA857|nr:phage tail protein [Pseudomonas putida]GLO25420.1 hypothetical protein PPUJ21368_32490 [Pseudomonas putida]HDS0968624.1 phage tail protein [Pseudomonas putida]
MSTTLQPVITKGGLAAIFNASKTGLSAEITHVVLGTSGYTVLPGTDQKVLRAQVGKYPIAGGEKLTSTLLHLTAVVDGAAAFWVREIGFLLSDGTLLAVWSHATEALTFKPAGDQLLLAYDLSLAALPADSVTINTTSPGLNLTLAEPLAAQATAVVAELLRTQLQQDKHVSHERLLRIADEQIAGLQARLTVAEKAAAETREGLLSATVASATGLMSLQYTLVQHMYGS